MDAKLGAEAPAHVRGDDVNPFRVDLQGAGDRGPSRRDDLRTDVKDQLVPARYRQAGVWLHRLGELERRRITLINPDRGGLVPGGEIAHRGVGPETESKRLRGVGRLLASGEVVASRLHRRSRDRPALPPPGPARNSRQRPGPPAHRNGGCRGRSAPERAASIRWAPTRRERLASGRCDGSSPGARRVSVAPGRCRSG